MATAMRDYADLDAMYDPSKNKTSPYVSRYEAAKMLGIRTEQFARGAKPLVALDTPELVAASPARLAEEELAQKRMPFIVVRPLPDGTREFWKMADMLGPL